MGGNSVVRGLLVAPPLFFGEQLSVNRQAIAGDTDQSISESFELVVPAPFPRFGVDAKDFTLGGGVEIIAIQNYVHEITTRELNRPELLAIRWINRDD